MSSRVSAGGCGQGGAQCWVDASPSGLQLYRKLGWEEVETCAFNLGAWGGEIGAVHRVVGMVRKGGPGTQW
jgi:hypothetical protein